MRGTTFESGRNVRTISALLRGGLVLMVCLGASVITAAQDPTSVFTGSILQPAKLQPAKPPTFPLRIPLAPNLVRPPSKTAVGAVRVITLEEAQQAAAGQNPMVRLGQLSVEAAKQNRQVYEASYFPQISSTFANMHFNKFMGEEIQIRRPIQGTTTSASLPLAGKDSFLAAFTVMQPLTPLLKVQQAVKIARADENIARAKAGMPVSETSRNVEKNYFDLLIGQQELTVAQLRSKRVQEKYLIASNSSAPRLSAEAQAEMIDAEKILVVATSKVRELSNTLNALLGWRAETELELVRPSTQVEDVNLARATQNALESNPEVIEAEQAAIKARAGRKLAKLDYVPDVVVLGGYAYQPNLIPLLPRDFSFIGVMATYSIFDGGKREHTLKQRNAQVEMAELAVELTKAKVSAGVKTSYLEMERSRALTELSQRMISASQVVNASYQPDSLEVKEARARLEVEVLRAESAYREAFGRLKTLMGN